MKKWVPIEEIYEDGRYVGIKVRRQLVEGDEAHPIVDVEAEVEVPGTKSRLNLGHFQSLYDAAWAYDFAATLLHTACAGTQAAAQDPKLNHASSSRGSVKMRDSPGYRALAQRLAGHGGDAHAIARDLNLQRCVVLKARAYRHADWHSDRMKRIGEFRDSVKEPLARFFARTRHNAVAFTSDYNHNYAGLELLTGWNEVTLGRSQRADMVSSLQYGRMASLPDFVSCLASYPIAGYGAPVLEYPRGDQNMQTMQPPAQDYGSQNMQTMETADDDFDINELMSTPSDMATETADPSSKYADHGGDLQKMQPMETAGDDFDISTLISFPIGMGTETTDPSSEYADYDCDLQKVQPMEIAGDDFDISTLISFSPDMAIETTNTTFELSPDYITNAGTNNITDMQADQTEPTDALANFELIPKLMITNNGTNNNIDMLGQMEPPPDALANVNYAGTNDVSMSPPRDDNLAPADNADTNDHDPGDDDLVANPTFVSVQISSPKQRPNQPSSPSKGIS